MAEKDIDFLNMSLADWVQSSPPQVVFYGWKNQKNVKEKDDEAVAREEDVSIIENEKEPSADVIFEDEAEDDFEKNAKELKSYISASRNPGTVLKTKRDVMKVHEYFRECAEGRNMENIPAKQLDILLGRYFLNLKKPSGEEYEPSTLTAIFGSIKRYLEDKDYGKNVVTDVDFATCRKIIESRKKNLKAEGFGNKPFKADAITPEEEKILWEKKLMGPDDPRALRNALWYLFTKYLGFRGRQETRQLKWGDIVEKTDSNGVTFLEFNERNTKTRTGATGEARPFPPKMWRDEEHPVRCPIFLHREYTRHRPAKMMGPETPYFLSINHRRLPSSDTWYSCLPMGANEIGRIMPTMAQQANLQGKKTNHSVRKTSCSSLLHAGVPPVMVAQLSGHKSLSSLQSYSNASYDQQKTMYSILTQKKQPSAALGAPPAKKPKKTITWKDQVHDAAEEMAVPDATSLPEPLTNPNTVSNLATVEQPDDDDLPASQTQEEYHGKGTTDGGFRKEQYFTCPMDSAIFVGINKVRAGNENLPFRESLLVHSPAGAAEPPYSEEGEQARPPLEPGERVVWMSDSGPEAGVVKWIGHLHDTRDKEWTVGVEFDNAVGTGTGKYKERQLFRAQQNHASLIPILGLIKYNEFYGTTPPLPKKTMEPNQQVRIPEPTSERPIPPARLRSRGHDRSIDPAKAKSRASLGADDRDGSVTLPRTARDVRRSDALGEPAAGAGAGAAHHYSTTLQREPRLDWVRDGDGPRKLSANSGASPSHWAPRDFRDGDWDSVPALRNPSGRDSMPDSGTPPLMLQAAGNGLSIYDMENGLVANHGDKVSLPMDGGGLDGRGSSAEGHPDAPGREGSSPLFEYHHKRKDETPDNPESAIHNLWRTHSASSRSDSGSSRAHTSPIPGHQLNSGLSPHQIYHNHSQQQSSLQHQQLDTLTRAQQRSRDYDTDSGPKSLDPAEIDTDLETGSMVEVVGNPPNCQYGVIRWMGYLNDKNKPIVGLEMEEENSACTDGTFGSRHLFNCPPRKAFFVYLHKCRRDPRFEESTRYLERSDSQLFGSMESPDIPGTVAPPGIIIDIQQYCGKGRGIQGHHNSCYLDATLFSMFAFTMVFDTILYRPRMEGDLDEYEQVQHVLKDSIVNPLRKNFYVRADKILRLRSLLDKLSSVKGLTTEEKDPEEFLNSLLQQIMRAEAFLKLSNGQESYYYQLFIEKDERLVLPTTQQLLGLSFLQADIKLAEVPSCLILQMPRFGKNYKMYKRIVPSLYLDITDILDYGPRECTICGELANYECKECYTHFGDGLDQIAFCNNCLRKSHSHSKRSNHRPKELKTHPAFIEYLNSRNLQQQQQPTAPTQTQLPQQRHEQQKQQQQQNGATMHREVMELFAVVCIETSHYVAFVKGGTGPSAPWVFFDSMADRMGEQHGYNVPEVREVPDMNEWLADHKQNAIMAVEDDKRLPGTMKRLLCDGYMCMYQSTDTMMYK